jgi:hypothetical protein
LYLISKEYRERKLSPVDLRKKKQNLNRLCIKKGLI